MTRAATFLRRSPILLLAAVLVALAVFVAGNGAPPASAQATPTVLTSNIGKTQGEDTDWNLTLARAQGFTTGSNAHGYNLASIEWKVTAASALTDAQIGRLRVELWSATTGGAPDAMIASLEAPSSVATGNVAFTAPEDTTLAADTTYFAYLFKSAAQADVGDLKPVTTTSDDEDSGGAAGWSILNTAHYHQSGTWSALPTQAHNIRVNGSSLGPATLVSNLGQTAGITNFDLSTASDAYAQQFTTGSETGGYALGSIYAVIRNVPATEAQRDTIRAELWSAVASGAEAGEPDAKIARPDGAGPSHLGEHGVLCCAGQHHTVSQHQLQPGHLHHRRLQPGIGENRLDRRGRRRRGGLEHPG